MFPKIILVGFILVVSSVLYSRRRLLPPALVLLIVSLFFSRIYWRARPFTLRWESLVCLALALNLAWDVGKKRLEVLGDIKVFLVLGLFPLMLVSSAFFSPEPLLSLKKSLIYVPFLLAFFALTQYLRQRERFVAAWDLFFVGGVLSVTFSAAGLVLFLRGIDLGMVRMEFGLLWLRGTSLGANIMGSTAVVVLAMALARLTKIPTASSRKTWIPAAALVPATVCVISSMTRAAWLSAGLALLLVGLVSLRLGRLKLFLIGMAVVVVSAAGTYWLTSRLPARVPIARSGVSWGEYGEPSLDKGWRQDPRVSGFDYSLKVGSGRRGLSTWTNRWLNARLALDDWRRSPIIGRGTESLSIGGRHGPLSYIPITWVAILHDWGLLGLGLYLAFLWLTGWGMLRLLVRDPKLPEGQLAFSLLLVFVLYTLMVQISTTMQLSIFWVLCAFFAVGSSSGEAHRSSVSFASASEGRGVARIE